MSVVINQDDFKGMPIRTCILGEALNKLRRNVPSRSFRLESFGIKDLRHSLLTVSKLDYTRDIPMNSLVCYVHYA